MTKPVPAGQCTLSSLVTTAIGISSKALRMLVLRPLIERELLPCSRLVERLPVLNDVTCGRFTPLVSGGNYDQMIIAGGLAYRISGTKENRAGATYSATDTRKTGRPVQGGQPGQDASIKEKVEDLIALVEGVKFGMMAARQSQSGLLVSRCMPLAERVLAGVQGNGIDFLFHTNT
ncbi:hypothetical protein HOY80DRAFT_1003417 [Tuber brumale]|nr:hypothetical protein HOY80DRAFT_1003417 [Tuber brumale]